MTRRLVVAITLAGTLGGCPSRERTDAGPARSPIVEVASSTAAPSAESPAPPVASECVARVEAASRGLETALERARRPCASAADCEATHVELGCFGTCPVSVSRAQASALRAEVRALDEASCRGYRAQCPGHWATPRCLFGAPTCRDGACAFEMPAQPSER